MSSRPVLAGPVPPFRSGIADQTARLARALTALGEPPLVVTFRRMYPRFLYPGSDERGAGPFPEGLDVRPLLSGLSPWSFRSAANEIAAAAPSAVFVAWWTSFFAPHVRLLLSRLAHETKAPRILLCHNLVDHESGPVRRALSLGVLRAADALAVQNAEAAEEARALAPRALVAVVPHPSEPPAHAVSRSVARRALGVPEAAPLFLFTGLLRPYKGWDVLAEAFARLRASRPDALLAYAGEPWGDARAFTARPPEGVLVEAAYLPAERRGLWLSAADAVVCPYRHATGSGIAADALAFGRPVVGTRVPGLVDVIEDGVSGLLVPPEDPLALEAALRRFLEEELGNRLAEGARAAHARFTPEAHARALLDLASRVRAPR